MPTNLLAGKRSGGQGPTNLLQARRDELALSNREQRRDIASSELGASRTPGFLDYVPGAGVIQDIPDIVSHGFNSAPIRARRQRREEAARQSVPFAMAALGGGAGAAARASAGLVGRAVGAGLGSGAGDVVGQAISQGGEVDPNQAVAATVGGAIGQPVGEALGAALPAATRFVLRGGEAGRQGVQNAIDDAARFGEVPTVAQATESSFLDSVESILAKTPGSAGRLRDTVRRTTDNVRQGLQSVAQQGRSGALDSEAAGQAIIEGVEGFHGRFQARASSLFDAVIQEVGEATPVTVTNTTSALSKLTSAIPGAENVSERFTSPFIKGLADDLAADVADNGLMPIAALRRVRSLVGEKLSNPSLTSDVPRAQLKQLYGAISDDIAAAAKSAGPRAEKAYRIANSFYRSRLGHIERNLEPLIKNRAPERVFDALVSSSRSGPTQIRNVYRSLNQEQQDAVTGAVIRRMGTATPGQQGAEGGEFSFNTFLTRWNQIDEGARNAIFNRGRYAQLGQDVNALARYAGRVKEASQAFANPSGTSGATLGAFSTLIAGGSVAASPFLGAGALTLPLVLGAGSGVANIGARLMTSPRVVNWLAQATKVKPEGFGAHIGRLSAIAAKENRDVQEAIGGYLDLLQSPIGGTEAAEVVPENTQQVETSAQQPEAAPEPPTPTTIDDALANPSGIDPQIFQTLALAELVKSIRGQQGQPGQADQAPAGPTLSEEDAARLAQFEGIQQERDEMARQLQALRESGQISGQQVEAMSSLAAEQHELLTRQANAITEAASIEQQLPEPKGRWQRRSATPQRDDQGRIIAVEIVEENEEGKVRTRLATVKRDEFGRLTGLEIGR